MATPEFELLRTPAGKLDLVAADGRVHEGVTAVRAFPISDPERHLALLSAEGKELAWIDRLDDLPPGTARALREAFAARELMPEILRIASVSGFATPSTWELETDRGATRLVLKGEEDIRRLGGAALLVTDSHGLSFLIRDPGRLDKHSRRLLDHFL